MDDPEKGKEGREVYERFRDHLLKIQLSNDENFDKAILSLSSAGLGLSLAFIKNIIPLNEAIYLWMLIGSWFLFASSIIITVISYRISQLSIERQLDYAAKYYLEGEAEYLSKRNIYAHITAYINSVSGIGFVAAVILTVLFVSLNVMQGDLNMSKEINKNRTFVRDGATLPTMQKIESATTVKKGATLPAMQPIENSRGATLPGMQPIQNPTSQQSGSATQNVGGSTDNKK